MKKEERKTTETEMTDEQKLAKKEAQNKGITQDDVDDILKRGFDEILDDDDGGAYYGLFHNFVTNKLTPKVDINYVLNMTLSEFKGLMEGSDIKIEYRKKYANETIVRQSIYRYLLKNDILDDCVEYISKNIRCYTFQHPMKGSKIDIVRHIFTKKKSGTGYETTKVIDLSNQKHDVLYNKYIKEFLMEVIIPNCDDPSYPLYPIYCLGNKFKITDKHVLLNNFKANFYSRYYEFLITYKASEGTSSPIVKNNKTFKIKPIDPILTAKGLASEHIDYFISGDFVTFKSESGNKYFNLYHRFPIDRDFNANNLWEKYLRYVAGDNETMYKSLLYVMSTMIFEHRTMSHARASIILSGARGTGKSLFLDSMEFFVGEQNIHNFTASDLNKNNDFSERTSKSLITVDDMDDFSDRKVEFGGIVKADTSASKGAHNTKYVQKRTTYYQCCHYIIAVNEDIPLYFKTDDSEHECFLWCRKFEPADAKWFMGGRNGSGNKEILKMIKKLDKNATFGDLGRLMRKGGYRFLIDILIPAYNELLQLRKEKHYRFGCPIPETELYKLMNLTKTEYGFRLRVRHFFEKAVKLYHERNTGMMAMNETLNDAITNLYEKGMIVTGLFNDPAVSKYIKVPKTSEINEFLEKGIMHSSTVYNPDTYENEAIMRKAVSVRINKVCYNSNPIHPIVWDKVKKSLEGGGDDDNIYQKEEKCNIMDFVPSTEELDIHADGDDTLDYHSGQPVSEITYDREKEEAKTKAVTNFYQRYLITDDLDDLDNFEKDFEKPKVADKPVKKTRKPRETRGQLGRKRV